MSVVPKPELTGGLRATPLAEVVAALFRRKLTGTLAVWSDKDELGQDRVLFRDGAPVSVMLRDDSDTADAGLLKLFAPRNAPFAFYTADLVQESGKPLSHFLDPLQLVAESLRRHFSPESATGFIKRLGETPQRLRRGAGLDRMMLRVDERVFVEYLRAAPASVPELVDGFGDSLLAVRILYLFQITGNLTAYSPETKKHRRLSLPARPAMFPDQSSLTGRHSLLPSVVGARPRTPLQNARRAARAQDWGAANSIVDAEISKGNDDADHLSLKAWVLFQERGVDNVENLKEVRSLLRKASRRDIDHVYTYYVSGKVHRAIGNEKQAIACFKKVAKLDPTHLEAGREVSLSNIRKSMAPRARVSLFAKRGR